MPRIPMVRSLCVVALLALVAPAFGEKVDNPTYLAWAKYKPGTSVSLESTAVMGDAPAGSPMAKGMKTEITQTLKAVTPDAATVSVQMKIDMPGVPTPPAHDITVPAKVDKNAEYLPQSMDHSQEKYEVKDVKDGTDTLTIDGNKIQTTTHQMTLIQSADHSTSHVKIWTSVEVPCNQVKMTAEGDMGPDAHNMKMSTEVKSYKIVK